MPWGDIFLGNKAGEKINPATEDGNLDTIRTRLESILAEIDVSFSTRSSEATLLFIKTDLDTVASQLDVALSTRASESTLSAIKTDLDSVLSQLDVALSTRSSEATLVLVKTDLDDILSKLDVALSTRASEATLSSVKTDLDEIALDTDSLADIKIDVDKIPADPSREGGNLLSIKTNTDKLDVLLSTRLAEATFTSRINTLGQKTSASSTPIVIASDQTVIPISDNGGSLTVDGTVAATQSGTWNITNISGTISLPTGAATEATLALAKTDLDTLAGTVKTTGYGTNVTTGFKRDSVGLLGHLRISLNQNLFTSYFTYDKQPLLWDETTATGGTSTHDPVTSSVLLAVTTSSGSSVIRQSREYIHYEPGKPSQVLLTGVFGAGTANCVQRIGLFDANNGLFFELNGTTLRVVRRSNTTGSIVDTAIAQSSWNLDKLDGTGVSGETLDITKSHLMVIEYLWLGVGPIRYGFYINGRIIYCHQTENSNILSGVYIATGSLPIRYEIANIGVIAGAVTLRQICCAVGTETPNITIGVRRSANTGATARVVVSGAGNQPVALLTIRLKSGFNRATIIPRHYTFVATTADNLFYQIILNGTIAGSPSYTSIGADSAVEFDVAGTTISGGTVISSGYISSQGRDISSELDSRVRLVANIVGTSDTLSLAVSSVGVGGFTVSGSLDWQEYF